MTRSNIASCLSEMEDSQKRDFLSLMLRLDIRIRLIKNEKENYYKIWILRKDRRTKVFITDYYREHGLEIPIPRLQDILNTIRGMVDVPPTYEEYCMEWLPKPLRQDYLRAVQSANRFAEVLNRNEVQFIPYFQKGSEECFDIDLDTQIRRLIQSVRRKEIKECKKAGFSVIRLRELTDYYQIKDLIGNLVYLEKLLKQYGFDPKTGELNEDRFPIPKSDKELEGIIRDIENFDDEMGNLDDYIQRLANKQCIRLSSKGIIIYPPLKVVKNDTHPIIIEFS